MARRGSFAAKVESLESRQLLAAGVVDRTFGSNGWVSGSIAVPEPDSVPPEALLTYTPDLNAPFVYPDGRVLMAFPAVQYSNYRSLEGQPSIARFKPDGTLDNSFGINGIIYFGDRTIDIDNYLVDVVFKVDKDQWIYLLSRTDDASKLTRLTSTGDVDTSFAGDGTLELPFSDSYRAVPDLQLDKQGLPVFFGQTGESGTSAMLRVTSSGEIETPFGSIGDQPFEPFSAFAVDRVGRVVAPQLGLHHAASPAEISIQRYLAGGALDFTFGDHGTLVLRTPNVDKIEPMQILSLPQGDYRVVTAHDLSGGLDIYGVKANGKLDPSFGIGGRVSLAEAREPTQGHLVVAMSGDGGMNVFASEGGVDKLVHLSLTGSIVRDVPARFASDPIIQTERHGTPAFRGDGGLIAAHFTKGGEVSDRLTSLVAVNAHGQSDPKIKSFPRFTPVDVLTVTPTGQPVMVYREPYLSYAGVATRGPDGVYKPSASVASYDRFGLGRPSWTVSRGTVSVVDVSVDPSDLDVAYSTVFLNQQGESHRVNGTYAEFGKIDVMPLPLGYVYLHHYDVYFGPETTELYDADGNAVHINVQYEAEWKLIPRRTSIGAFLIAPPQYEKEAFPGLDAVFAMDAWFSTTSDQLLYFDADRKHLLRTDTSLQPDPSFHPISLDGWNFDLDSHDRVIEWRVLHTGGVADGDIQVQRFNPDGTIDQTFGKNGLAIVDMKLATDAEGQVYVDANDNLILTSIERNAKTIRWTATRLSAGTVPLFTLAPTIVLMSTKSPAERGTLSLATEHSVLV